MKRLTVVLASAVLLTAAAGCNDKETRSGSVTLTGAANIPLKDKSGARAELVSGPADLTFQKGSQKNTIAVKIVQPARPEVNLEAPVSGNYSSGNFTVRAAESGQPVDLVSRRDYAVTGPTQYWSSWEDQGFERCLVQNSFDPCDENWTVSFVAPTGALGSFASRTATRCNERSWQSFCQPIPGREPRIPDFPHGPRGHALDDLKSVDPGSVKFD